MENCSVEKLIGGVQNENLQKLGVLILRHNPSYSGNDNLVLGDSQKKITVVGSGKLYFTLQDAQNDTNGFTTYEGDQASFYFSAGEYYLEVESKYIINKLLTYKTFTVDDTIDLEYMLYLTQINAKILQGDIAILAKLTALTSLIFRDGQSIIGNIESLWPLSGLTTLDISDTKVEGDVTDFTHFPALTSLRLSNSRISGNAKDIAKLNITVDINLNGTSIETCTVEDFVTESIASGFSSRNLAILNVTKMFSTFGGNAITSSLRNTLEINTANKVILKLFGSGPTSGNPTKVYAKGASAEEIAAWEATGATVVVIS